jgi:diguanylate cyclase (GGDEF)-like protein/PAS domain S-box-containing protein
MLIAPLPADEEERLRALQALDVLDSGPEREFDALTATAALVCGVPISLVSLIDGERQWFKAQVGLEGVRETARDISFCGHAIMEDGLFEVPDALADARFADNPLVLGDPDIRFYAGAPLRLSSGARIGTLCVIDRVPRQLDTQQRAVMEQLAVAAVQALENRRRARDHYFSEMRFRALSDASPLGVFATDAHGACTYTNARWREIYGLTEQEALGDGWSRTLHPDDQTAVFAAWRQAAADRGVFDMEFRLRRTDGSVRHVRSVSRPTQDESGRVVSHVGSVEDITERLQTRRALESERERLAAILEGTGAGTWEWNVQTGETRFNERWAAIVGQTLETLGPTTIQTWAALAHPDDLARSAALLEAHFAGRSPTYDCEARMRHRDGHWVWVLDRGRLLTRTPDGQPEWMFGTHLDITERVAREEQLRKREQLLSSTGEMAQVGGWELELATSALMWTDQTCRIHGLPPGYRPQLAEAINFYAPEARPVVEAAVRQAMVDGSGWDLELPFIQACGRRIWVRAVGHAEFENGRPVRMLGAIQDVTDQVAQRQQLADQHELLQVTLQSIGDAVITTDAQGIVTWLNPAAERMTDWSCREALGLPLAQVFSVRHEGPRQAGATVLVSRRGVEFGIEDSTAPIRNAAGEVLGTVLVFRDVTEQRRLSGEMSYRATHDALTGLFNRTEFESRLQRMLQSTREQGAVHAMMYIDLDQFKLVNDACGHAVGDQLLQQVAGVLKQTVRTRDTLARLGGDEFAVILEHCTAEQGLRVAQKICDRMEEFRFIRDERRFRVGASIGLVPIDSRWIDVAAALQAADSACYTAKEAGRNRVHTWLDSDQALSARQGELQWASRLEQALDEDMFVLFAQRIVPLGPHSEGLHAEVLLRLRERDGTLVAPGAFLPAVERFHMAARLDRWVLKHALAWLQALPDPEAVDTLSVNLSGLSVGDRAFHHFAVEALKLAGPDLCRRLCLEITETAAVTRLADAARFIDQVRSLGVRIALDDFGAGASSFGYLKSLKVDVIKIDGSFIRDLVDDPLDDAAVRCFADVARVIGVRTVAEFVDRPEVLERVRAIGIDFAQGYLLHRPEPLSALCVSIVQPACT